LPNSGGVVRRSALGEEKGRSGMRKTIVVVASVAAALLLASAMSSVVWEKQAQALIPAENGKVVFVAHQGDEEDPDELFTVNPDGSELTQITDLEGMDVEDRNPAFSPDGEKIAFSRIEETDTGFSVDIYTANADGTGLKKLTHDPAFDDSPTWSPDGKEIAFTSTRNGTTDASNRSDIYVTNADGTGEVRRITDWPGNEGGPAWSPDGSKLLYVSTADTPAFPNPGGDSEIYAMNPDGSGVSRLTDNTMGDGTPDWSPDGTKIAFSSNRDGKAAIYTMNPDGSEQAKIVADIPPDGEFIIFLGDHSPAWSPDGTKIVFARSFRDVENSNCCADIYTMNADGSRVTPLASLGLFNLSPDWAPKDTTPPPDTMEPRVTSTVPTNKATGVDPTTNITATFSEDMLASSINPNTFKLFEKGTNTKLSAKVSYSASTNTATLEPTDSLQRGATYRAVVSTKVKDLAGNHLDQNSTKPDLQQKRWSFTTAAHNPPTLSYSAVGDFSATQNPSGAWSYGYRPSPRWGFILYTDDNISHHLCACVDGWSAETPEPFIVYNHTGETVAYFPPVYGIIHPPDVLNVHPGPAGEMSVARWTAPSSGTVKIEGRFGGIDWGGGTTTDVAVVHNSAVTLFRGNINGYGATAPFSITESVTAGDTIDFSVGFGRNRNYGADSTGLSGTISY